jgi:hypothetical protein
VLVVYSHESNMWMLYAVSAIVGGGLLLAQLLLGGGHDADVHGFDHGPHPGHGHALLSVRSLTFAVAGFGIVGISLQALHVMPSSLTLLTAMGAGAISFMVTGLAFRKAADPDVSGAANVEDLVGVEGRLLLACGVTELGKVRVSLGGHAVDLLASTREGRIDADARVVVVEVREDVVLVRETEGRHE